MTTAPAPTTELQLDTCWQLLRDTEMGRLAVVVAGRPEIFPVNYAIDHGTVVFRTAPGTKLAAVASSPAVAFEADGYDKDTDQAWSVVVKGSAEVVHGAAQLLDTTDLPLFPWQATTKGQFVRIVADEVTGRRFRKVDASFWDTPFSGVRPQPPE